MSVIEEKLQKALAFKEEGNELYKAKDYKKAMRKYHNAILYLKGIDNDLHGTPAFLQHASVDPDSKVKISHGTEQQCISANISVYNNLAACILANVGSNKAEADHEKVVKYTDIVLELDKDNEKALFRKGQALRALKDFANAQETFETLKAVQEAKGQPVSREAVQYIHECRQVMKGYAASEKAMCRNMFK